MQKDYEIFIEDLQEKIYQKGEIPRENMKFEREGGKYAIGGDRLLVKFAEHEDAWEMCGVYTQELFRAFQEGRTIESEKLIFMKRPGIFWIMRKRKRDFLSDY